MTISNDVLWSEKARLEGNLYEFVKAGWSSFENSRFEENWHIELMADHLEDIAFGRIRKLMINIPPRHMKSVGANIFMPAWVWAQNPKYDPITRTQNNGWDYAVANGQLRGPGVKFAHISYSDELSNRDSVACRRVISSSWYQDRWGHQVKFQDDENQKTKFYNTQGGFRYAFSMFGQITGFGADIFIIDDPHNIRNIDSDVVREKALDVWSTALPSRLNDPRTSAWIMIMQRSHPRDMTGYVLARELNFTQCIIPDDPEEIKKSWVHVTLPARFEPDHPFSFKTPVARRRGPDKGKPWTDSREPGELLWPKRWNDDAIEELAARMPAHSYDGQYQQRPSAKEGNLFKRSWFGEPVLSVPEGAKWSRVRSWDMAATEQYGRNDPDWSVGLLMSKDRLTNIIYIEDVVRLRGTPKAVFAEILRCAFKDGLHTRIRIPQDPGAAGKAHSGDLAAKLQKWSLIIEREEGSKARRAQGFAIQCEQGNVCLVRGDWNEAFIEELCSFPNGKDDQLDAACAAYRATLFNSVPLQGRHGSAD